LNNNYLEKLGVTSVGHQVQILDEIAKAQEQTPQISVCVFFKDHKEQKIKEQAVTIPSGTKDINQFLSHELKIEKIIEILSSSNETVETFAHLQPNGNYFLKQNENEKFPNLASLKNPKKGSMSQSVSTSTELNFKLSKVAKQTVREWYKGRCIVSGKTCKAVAHIIPLSKRDEILEIMKLGQDQFHAQQSELFYHINDYRNLILLREDLETAFDDGEWFIDENNVVQSHIQDKNHVIYEYIGTKVTFQKEVEIPKWLFRWHKATIYNNKKNLETQ